MVNKEWNLYRMNVLRNLKLPANVEALVKDAYYQGSVGVFKNITANPDNYPETKLAVASITNDLNEYVKSLQPVDGGKVH